MWLKVVEGEGKRLWNEYVGRYHPLSYKQPFGYRMRYFVVCRQGPLGCLLFSGAAKSLGVRDWWIGWTEIQRLQRLAWVVNLSRHLVFPWVQVPNLSSHVLGQLARRISTDWHSRWGYRPVLMETFVGPSSHEGSCYRAAGWNDLGMTTGEGLVRPGHSYSTRHSRYAWISDLPFCKKTVHKRCNLGARHRWAIEESILVEKHQGYNYEHCYAYDWNAMRGYHYLLRIGHLLNVLAAFSGELVKVFKEKSPHARPPLDPKGG